MIESQINRLKSVLSVPTKTYQEDKMVEYICNELDNIEGIDYYLDEMKNIYVTKGKLLDGMFYPMFIAHTDTVHNLVDEIVVKEEMIEKPHTFGMSFDDGEHLSLKGYTPDGNPTGIGGDDKCGVFLALELLRTLQFVKIGLFVSEETGCHGSQKCDLEFLKDVGYAVQFDAPGNHLITEVCSGVRMYEKDGEFINRIIPIFKKNMGVTPLQQSHPYTDVSQIKRKGDFSCINFSCGYYRMHTPEEFVVIKDIEDSFKLALEVVNNLGYEKYEYTYEKPNYLNSSQGVLFSDDEDLYEDDYDYEDSQFVEGKGNYFYVSNDVIEIESKTTGHVLKLEKEDMADMYLIIREILLNEQEI